MYLKLNLHHYILVTLSVTGQHILRYSAVQVAMRAFVLSSGHYPCCTLQVALQCLVKL